MGGVVSSLQGGTGRWYGDVCVYDTKRQKSKQAVIRKRTRERSLGRRKRKETLV